MNIMQRTEFSKILNSLLDTIFQSGIYKPIDVVIFLLVSGKVEKAGGVVYNKDIMDKLGITEKEYLDCLKRLEKHGVLTANKYLGE